jgi:hypothetical protein
MGMLWQSDVEAPVFPIDMNTVFFVHKNSFRMSRL